jgi:hypothetical protein
MAHKLSKQDAEQMQSIVERMDDPRLRYFFLMLGSVIADRLGADIKAAPGRPRNPDWVSRVEQ